MEWRGGIEYLMWALSLHSQETGGEGGVGGIIEYLLQNMWGLSPHIPHFPGLFSSRICPGTASFTHMLFVGEEISTWRFHRRSQRGFTRIIAALACNKLFRHAVCFIVGELFWRMLHIVVLACNKLFSHAVCFIVGELF